MTFERQPAALDLQHVLEPGLEPTAIDHVTLDLGALSDQRCEAAAVADAEQKYRAGIDERVVAELAKGGAIRGQLRVEIGGSTITLRVADSGFVHAHRRKPGKACQALKQQLRGISRARRRLDRVAAQPSDHEYGR